MEFRSCQKTETERRRMHAGLNAREYAYLLGRGFIVERIIARIRSRDQVVRHYIVETSYQENVPPRSFHPRFTAAARKSSAGWKEDGGGKRRRRKDASHK